MWKFILSLPLVFGLLVGLSNYLDTPPTVKAATEDLTETSKAIKEAAVASTKEARQLTDSLQRDTPAVPARLQAFKASTEELNSLSVRLHNEIRSYHDAAQLTIAKFDEESKGITDPVVLRNVSLIRRKVLEEHEARERSAKQTEALLDAVLAKGSDLQRAANCIIIADELHQTGTTLDDVISEARRSANDYSTTTNDLLTRLNTVATELAKN